MLRAVSHPAFHSTIHIISSLFHLSLITISCDFAVLFSLKIAICILACIFVLKDFFLNFYLAIYALILLDKEHSV